MPLDFPSSPSVDDTYAFSDRTWKWNGEGWQLVASSYTMPDGTASAPGLVFTDDTDTGVWRPTADTLAISTGGSERIRVSSDGVTFHGDTAAANALDDYEEGTWTPAIAGTGTAGTGTYSVQVGRYTKVGNIVTAHLHLTWSAHTGTTSMRVTGLPFTSANVTNLTPVASVTATSLTITGIPRIIVTANATTADIFSLNNGTQAALAMDTAATLRATITYQAA